MYIEILPQLSGTKLNIWIDFLRSVGLEADRDFSQVVLIWEDKELIASGCRMENLLKCIAVNPHYRGHDLTASVLTALRQGAFDEGYRHLFLYTKPENLSVFSSLFFYPVVQTKQVLLMEDQKDGIQNFLKSLSPAFDSNSHKTVGAILANCNPFTLGHRHLIRIAAQECDLLYVFVLSEDKSHFSAADRMEMVRLGTRDLQNVSVLPTGPYLISSATFPTYFLKNRDQAQEIHCQLDIEIFIKYFVPYFSITRRYVGSEPLSPMTDKYNAALKTYLPEKGIEMKEIPRLQQGSVPISASLARQYITAGNQDALKILVPQTTFSYLQSNGLL